MYLTDQNIFYSIILKKAMYSRQQLLFKSLAETTARRGYNARLLTFVIIIHDPASF